jgi:sterol desaturase/sphingolipid hydroxylase (fatty acid hydroxylase superfamily)
LSHPFIITTGVRFLVLGVLLAAGLYAKRLPPGNARLWPILAAVAIGVALTIGETAYLRLYHAGRVH